MTHRPGTTPRSRRASTRCFSSFSTSSAIAAPSRIFAAIARPSLFSNQAPVSGVVFLPLPVLFQPKLRYPGGVIRTVAGGSEENLHRRTELIQPLLQKSAQQL